MNATKSAFLLSLTVHSGLLCVLFTLPATRAIPVPQIIQVHFAPQAARAPDSQGPSQPAAEAKGKQSPVPQITVAQPVAPQKERPPNPADGELRREGFAISPPGEEKSTVVSAMPADGAASEKNRKQGSAPTDIMQVAKAEEQPMSETRFGVTGAPTFIHREMPVYPLMARRLGREGKVVLKLQIDIHGKLQDVEVIERDGFGFTEAAIEAVKKSTYRPASRNGERIASKALLPIRFQLQ